MKIEDIKSSCGGQIKEILVTPGDFKKYVNQSGYVRMIEFPQVTTVEFRFQCGYIESYAGFDCEPLNDKDDDFWASVLSQRKIAENGLLEVETETNPKLPTLDIAGTEFVISSVGYCIEMSFEYGIRGIDLEKMKDYPHFKFTREKTENGITYPKEITAEHKKVISHDNNKGH